MSETPDLNPFIVGGALSDTTGFFGREDLFAFIRQSLHVKRRVPIVIYGQRRIGKSSVLRQLPHHLESDAVCVFYDLQGKASLDMDAALYGLAREINQQLGAPRPERATITEDTFLEGFLTPVLRSLGRAERLVLLFDEFDVVDSADATGAAAHRLLGYVSNLVEREPRVGYVFVVGRKMSELSDAFAGSLLRNSVSQRLGRFDRATTERLVREQAADVLAFDPSANDALFGAASGHPYCSQLLCHTVWKRSVTPGGTRPVPISAADVEAAVPDAVEFGTNGLNWIYDGLEVPAHRLFLAALAELSGPTASQAVPLAQIEHRLFERGTAVDAAELRSAPTELARWDVVEAAGDGFRFAVPMIGRWIRANRPLVELQQEAHLVNPRAWRYYELGLDAKRREEFDEAIAHFKAALESNPAMIDGWLALADCYRHRAQPGDLDEAVEAYQRAYDLDATGPRQGLLAALTEALAGSAHDVLRMAGFFKRIQALDPEGPNVARARRAVAEAAHLRLPFGRKLKEAEALYQVIGDVSGIDGVERRRKQFEPYERASAIAIAVFFLGVLLSFVSFAWLLGWTDDMSNGLRVSALALGIAGLVVGGEVEKEAAAGRLSLAALIAAGGVIAIFWFWRSLAGAGIGGFVVGVIAAAMLTPDRPLPAALKAPEPASSNLGLPERLAQSVATALTDYVSRKRDAMKRGRDSA